MLVPRSQESVVILTPPWRLRAAVAPVEPPGPAPAAFPSWHTTHRNLDNSKKPGARLNAGIRLVEGEVAGGQVAVGGERAQRRLLGRAQVLSARAASAEAAAGWGSDRRRELAAHALVLLGPFEDGVGDRHGVDQPARVRVSRGGVDRVGRADLDQLAEVHHT